MSTGMGDEYADVWADAGLAAEMRVNGPRFQIFSGVSESWRIAETNCCGEFTVAVFSTNDLDVALRECKLLNAAERTLAR